MIVFSTKNPSRNKFLLSLILLSGSFLYSPAGGLAANRIETKNKMIYDSRIGTFAFGVRSLATHRHSLTFENSESYGPWSLRASIRAAAESAYGGNPDHFTGTVAKQDSSEIQLRDCYIQFKKNAFQLILGNQQVVWGETFGFYFADLVNPKDFRDFGLMDLESQRIPVPILNLKYIFKNGALQTIVVPVRSWNKLPSPGSDYFSPALMQLGSATATFSEDVTSPMYLKYTEYGFRGSFQIGRLDLSILYFNYFDRMPNYQLTLTSFVPLSYRLDPLHNRIDSWGLTGTTDLSSLLLRWEVIYTPNRYFDYATSSSYQSFQGKEYTYVLGLDFTQASPWTLGMQFSQAFRVLPDVRSGPVTPERQTLISAHVMGTPIYEHTLEGNFSYMVSDGGFLAQFKYKLPVSRRAELGIGTDLLLGKQSSQFGQFKNASKIFLLASARLEN